MLIFMKVFLSSWWLLWLVSCPSYNFSYHHLSRFSVLPGKQLYSSITDNCHEKKENLGKFSLYRCGSKCFFKSTEHTLLQGRTEPQRVKSVGLPTSTGRWCWCWRQRALEGWAVVGAGTLPWVTWASPGRAAWLLLPAELPAYEPSPSCCIPPVGNTYCSVDGRWDSQGDFFLTHQTQCFACFPWEHCFAGFITQSHCMALCTQGSRRNFLWPAEVLNEHLWWAFFLFWKGFLKVSNWPEILSKIVY